MLQLLLVRVLFEVGCQGRQISKLKQNKSNLPVNFGLRSGRSPGPIDFVFLRKWVGSGRAEFGGPKVPPSRLKACARSDTAYKPSILPTSTTDPTERPALN